MATVNEIMSRFGGDYLHHYGMTMLPSHVKAIQALSKCRTEKMGSHEKMCLQCGHVERVYHSCRDRSCPQCFYNQTRNWLSRQEKRLLPIHYFHIIFTLPSQLRRIIRSHQKALYPILFQAAIKSLQSLAADERYVGGQLGAMAVLHTWSGAMNYHPHLHIFAPGCSLNRKGEVRVSRKQFLVPVKALSKKFRGCFLELARKAVPTADFSTGGDISQWNVFSKVVKPTKTKSVVHYLGRYLHRIAISNASILKADKEGILFRYKKATDKQGRSTFAVMKLAPMEFLRRFLQHVLPKGIVKIRYYGFLSPNSKKQYAKVKSFLMVSVYLKHHPKSNPLKKKKTAPSFIHICPHCGEHAWVNLGSGGRIKRSGSEKPP